MDLSSNVVELHRDGEIAVLRLSRPERLNAHTVEMTAGILAGFDACEADDTVRAIVITGAGRAFCAGADLRAGAGTFVLEEDRASGGAPPDSGGVVSLRIFRSTKPVIAAVNGPAVGVGVTMILPADVRIASETARFGFVFTRRGLMPEACSTWFLPRIVGIGTALEWAMGGRMVPAAEALERGLVHEVLPTDQVLPRAIAMARAMVAGTAPVSVALTRQALWRMLGAPDPFAAHRAESRGIYLRGRSADAAEGVEAFLSKREPVFTDALSDGLPDIFDDCGGIVDE